MLCLDRFFRLKELVEFNLPSLCENLEAVGEFIATIATIDLSQLFEGPPPLGVGAGAHIRPGFCLLGLAIIAVSNPSGGRYFSNLFGKMFLFHRMLFFLAAI